MATLRDIKLRIKGVKSTQQITKAMKMVATAKLRRATEAILNARPYAKKISVLLSNLANAEDKLTNPFFADREIKNVAIIVVTADRGLCGAFNTNILKKRPFMLNKKSSKKVSTINYIVLVKKVQIILEEGITI